MGIRSMVAAAVLAVGSGQAADAAIYHYELTYKDTLFYNVEIYDHNKFDPDDPDTYASIHYENLLASEDPFGLPTFQPNISPGDTLSFYMETQGDRISSCRLGNFHCHRWYDPYWTGWSDTPLTIWEEGFRVSFFDRNINVGTEVTLWDAEHMSSLGIVARSDDYTMLAGGRIAYFTVTDLAPVPLPAGAALLPVGIGALAVMRRRRRSLN